MTFLKWTALGVIILTASVVSSAQQKFPLRSGEWAATISSGMPNQPPTVFLYCLNDELWIKSLTQDPVCTVTQLNVTLTGASYLLNCPIKPFQMKGSANLSFDGMTHMVGKGSVDITYNGKTTHSNSQTDYRWKGPTCNPNTDMNLRYKKH